MQVFLSRWLHFIFVLFSRKHTQGFRLNVFFLSGFVLLHLFLNHVPGLDAPDRAKLPSEACCLSSVPLWHLQHNDTIRMEVNDPPWIMNLVRAGEHGERRKYKYMENLLNMVDGFSHQNKMLGFWHWQWYWCQETSSMSKSEWDKLYWIKSEMTSHKWRI